MSVMNTIAGGLNVAGTITNILSNAAPKNFYNLRDFYNFIRKEENCPMAHSNFFTIVPEINVKGLESLIGSSFGDTLSNIGNKLLGRVSGSQGAKESTPESFQFTEYNLARFALAAQSISDISFQSNNGGAPIKTPFGKTQIMDDNSKQPLTADKDTISITFMEMAVPIIEDFIIPWMIHLQKMNVDSISNKLNIVIKFYRQDEIAGLDFLMNPTFIYRITGLYPSSATLIKPAHGQVTTLTARAVTFKFDNIMVFSTAKYEKFITGNREYFSYDDLSPVQILNKLNYQASNVATVYNQIKTTF